MFFLFLGFLQEHFFALFVFVLDLFFAEAAGLAERIRDVDAVESYALVLAAVIEAKFFK